MGLVCEKVLLAAGISKSPGAVDWASDGTIVFGAGASVALMQHRSTGIDLMLTGHGDRVNAVRTFEYEGVGGRGLVSGSTDKTAKVWTQIGSEWRCVVRILRGLGRVGCACALRVVRAHTQHTHKHTTHVLGCRPPHTHHTLPILTPRTVHKPCTFIGTVACHTPPPAALFPLPPLQLLQYIMQCRHHQRSLPPCPPLSCTNTRTRLHWYQSFCHAYRAHGKHQLC